MTDVLSILKDSKKEFLSLPPENQAAYAWRMSWLGKAHDHQILPPGDWWTIWLLNAGRGAGKTRTAAEQIGWWAWTQPNTRWLVSAPTSADVRGTCFEGESGLLTVIPKVLVADYNRSYGEIKLINGSIIKGIPASEPERFRGGQYHGAWLDELAAWDYLQEAWDQIQFSVRLGTKTRIIASTTPKPKDLIVELVGRDGDDVVMTTASTYANIDNLAPSFRKQILQYEGTRLGRQEIFAEIIDPEESGIVKREMFRLWPANKAFPKFEYILQSYDCAYTEKTVNDATACLVFGIFKPMDGPMSVMVIDAWQERMQYPDLRPKVIEEYKMSYGADPEEDTGNFKGGKRVDLILVEDKAAGISLIQDLQRAHLPVRAYNPGRADKIQRLSIVANIIAMKRVWIPESTKNKGYVRDWAEGFVSQICSFPDAAHDDYVDACLIGNTLIQMADGTSKFINEVIVGDCVSTPNGSQRVTATFNNGIKEIWEVTVDDITLYGTNNHQVFTQRGYIRVDSLIEGVDNMSLYQENPSWHLKARAKLLLNQLSLTARNITDTLKVLTLHTVNIMADQRTGCTEIFGYSTRGQYPTDTKYTTLMETRLITTSTTYLASQEKNTQLFTLKKSAQEAQLKSIFNTSTISEQSLWRGIPQKKAKNGIVPMPTTLLQRLGLYLESTKRLKSIVSGVAMRCLQRLHERNSAQQGASQQSQDFVLVRQVRNTHTMKEVYDITVENEHCYYANGLLVHNCTQGLRYLRDAGFLDIDPEPYYDDDDYADVRPKRTNPYAV